MATGGTAEIRRKCAETRAQAVSSVCVWSSQQAAPALLGKDMSIVSSLLEVVVILWRSVSKALKQNEEAQKYTCAKFGSVMSKYFQAFEVQPLQCGAVVFFIYLFLSPE